MLEITEPPAKKPKKIESVDEIIQKVVNSETNLISILSDEVYNSIPLQKCYAGHIKDTKYLSTTIKVLNEKLPLKELQHLKRVTKNSVLVCPMDHLSQYNSISMQKYIESYVPELKDMFDYFREVEVPVMAPLTKKQYKECSLKWCCNFHPNKYIEKMLSGDLIFKSTELTMHRIYMGAAFKLANMCLSKDNYTPNLLELCSSDVNAAVVVDPTIQAIVAVALDNRKQHPIQHAAMLAIDNVAKTQNGGAWTDDSMEERIFALRNKCPQVTFDVRKYISKKDVSDTDNDVDSSPYLCTGYDIYMIREPCLMCAMGLVHARIRRVFFTFENHTQGALQSKTKLHCVKSLNHRFEVFTGFI